MEKYFTISEISKLFNIGLDSLRYYEKIGLISPKRGPNNYRLYRLGEMYRLNIIAELRKLHFSLEQIKEYMDNQSLNHTLMLLSNEKDEIKKEITRLRRQTAAINAQIEMIKEYQTKETNVVSIKHYEPRYSVQLETNFTIDEEFDFSIRCLLKKHGFALHQFDNLKIGASISLHDVKNGICGKYLNVFVVQNQEMQVLQDIMPGGDYLCYCYRGSYRNLSKCIHDILTFAEQKNLKLDDVIHEYYLIDNRYTVRTEEFLTEIQIRIIE
ncbi:MAG: MerR family transcriptional regulator [Negativicutes bacterium]|nr:MerR family transcriptional regulator [Negativicutes bacterium]